MQIVENFSRDILLKCPSLLHTIFLGKTKMKVHNGHDTDSY